MESCASCPKSGLRPLEFAVAVKTEPMNASKPDSVSFFPVDLSTSRRYFCGAAANAAAAVMFIISRCASSTSAITVRARAYFAFSLCLPLEALLLELNDKWGVDLEVFESKSLPYLSSPFLCPALRRSSLRDLAFPACFCYAFSTAPLTQSFRFLSSILNQQVATHRWHPARLDAVCHTASPRGHGCVAVTRHTKRPLPKWQGLNVVAFWNWLGARGLLLGEAHHDLLLEDVCRDSAIRGTVMQEKDIA